MKAKKVIISFVAYVDDDAIDELKRHIDHHLDYLIDLSSYPEIKSVSEGSLNVSDDPEEWPRIPDLMAEYSEHDIQVCRDVLDTMMERLKKNTEGSNAY